MRRLEESPISQPSSGAAGEFSTSGFINFSPSLCKGFSRTCFPNSQLTSSKARPENEAKYSGRRGTAVDRPASSFFNLYLKPVGASHCRLVVLDSGVGTLIRISNKETPVSEKLFKPRLHVAPASIEWKTS
ncbi:MAG: hypothetical protein FGF50_06070 [Candidatus Brockarchaeota archaeon]|nr:hypothetical protein [Candidatus Brockarchaeota archaeon]